VSDVRELKRLKDERVFRLWQLNGLSLPPYMKRMMNIIGTRSLIEAMGV